MSRTPELGHLLRWSYRAFEYRVLDELHAAGHPDVRLRHITLLAWMDLEGTRQATLVERAGLTAQAVSQLIEDLVGKGYLERRPALDDRRARLIVWTERGMRARRLAHEIVARVEDEYAERLGPRRYATMRACLDTLAQDIADGGALAERADSAM